MMGRCADFAVLLGRAALERFDPDWLWTGDDVASQEGLLFSPAAWRERVKPHLARVFALGRAAGKPVAYHCCGALRPIIPDLIEIGMDVLNPVQPNCPGMDPLELKREFGGVLSFMGGVDTQELLPRGTERQVRRGHPAPRRRDDRRRRRLHPGRLPHRAPRDAAGEHLRHVRRGGAAARADPGPGGGLAAADGAASRRARSAATRPRSSRNRRPFPSRPATRSTPAARRQ